jgi:hypothetical protein
MGAWAALLGTERTDEEVAALRASKVEFFSEHFDLTEFSCDRCAAVKTCEFAFDPYNTDGDCLAEK